MNYDKLDEYSLDELHSKLKERLAHHVDCFYRGFDKSPIEISNTKKIQKEFISRLENMQYHINSTSQDEGVSNPN